MLLEYNEDTNEDTLQEKAIVLRKRVAGRKLEESVAKEHLDVDSLLHMRELNRGVRKTHIEDSVDLTDYEIKDRVAFQRTDQHFSAVGQVRSLGKDVSRASRLSKARMDSLNDLEKRILAMRSQLSIPSVPLVETTISNDLRTNNKLVKLEGKFDTCNTCSRRILAVLLPTHERMCVLQAKEAANNAKFSRPPSRGIAIIDSAVVAALSTFKPQPPRNFHVKSIGVSYIDWIWDPPVIDGGLEVTDYEISYQARYSEFNRDIGKYHKWEESVPSLRTSQWVFRSPPGPVCSHGFKITFLRAAGEYFNFQIRSHNLRGSSDWVSMLTEETPFIKTEVSVPPTAPLFVTVDKITSSCIHLSWEPPFFDGGVPITEYIVYYTVVELQVTVTARDVRVEKRKEFNTESTATIAVIRNLPDQTDVIDIYICARNFTYHIGSKGMLLRQQVVRTLKSSRHALLQRELTYASTITEALIDTSFYTGVKQRLNRIEHIRQLSEELLVTDADALELEEAEEWAAVLEKQNLKLQKEQEALRLVQEIANQAVQERNQQQAEEDDEDDDNPKNSKNGKNNSKNSKQKQSTIDYTFSFKQRRDHFERKIKSLEQHLLDLNAERLAIDRKRIYATLQMRNKEKIMLQLQLEKERLKYYKGAVITSDVLTGADMEFKTIDFKARVEKAVSECISTIADLKYQVIEGENRRHIIKLDLQQSEETRKERIASFHVFNLHYEKTMRVMSRLDRNADIEKTKLLYFRKLQQFVEARHQVRQHIAHTFNVTILRYKKAAFHKWKTGEIELSSHDLRNFVSVGGVLLQQAFEKRSELQDLLRSAISETATVRQKLELTQLSKHARKTLISSSTFKSSEEGISHANLFAAGMTMFYEGDGYAMESKFDLATQCYEAQITLIRSKQLVSEPQQRQQAIKALAICHGRLGRMFSKLGHASRAVVEFDRQLSLAKEIGDKNEESDAFYGLGAGYLQLFDYENAIRYLTIAQALYLSLARQHRYVLCLSALKTCYLRLNHTEKAQIYQDKLKEASDPATRQLQLMHARLDEMKNKLVHQAAEIELIVKIERTTFRALELKHKVAEHDAKLKELELEVQAQDEVCGEVIAILTAIQTEYDFAVNSDATELYSALVHDQPQVVEIEELKTRLKQRRVMETDRLISEQDKKQKLLVRVKNTENNILEEDQQLALEEGALMKHSRLDRAFRCVGLCSTNIAGNEVTGTATGGYEEFIAAEGPHIHCIDYHSGELLHVFIGGDQDTGHTGLVTCLLHDGAMIFSGATDEQVICWDTITRSKIRSLLGHEGTIVALAAENTLLISAAADTTMRLWEKATGRLLRVLFGHSKSVLSLEIGATWLLTGSADHEVRVWKVQQQYRMHDGHHTHGHAQYQGHLHVTADSTTRLSGHEAPITCVKYGNIEVLSGDVVGRIFVWWLKTGQILRKCQVHHGPVKCLQFDSVHIVSGGADNAVCITDIATGEPLQSLRGHERAVLALAFDSERILSVGGDNTVRYWTWGKRSGPQDKIHILEPGQTLAAVAKLHNLTVDNIMKWNGIKETKQCHPGMKLIVKKGDPNALTTAERVAMERELQRANGMAWASKKLARVSGGFQDIALQREQQKYQRIRSIATDIDYYSLNNRLFGREKRQLELFPDTTLEHADKHSLAARIRIDHSKDTTQQLGMPNAKSAVPPRVFLTVDNEDEWGEIAKGLGYTMLEMMVELLSYEAVIEQKQASRSKHSVMGRIYHYQHELTLQEELQAKEEKEQAERALMPPITEEGEEEAVEGIERYVMTSEIPASNTTNNNEDFVLPPINEINESRANSRNSQTRKESRKKSRKASRKQQREEAVDVVKDQLEQLVLPPIPGATTS